MARERRGRMTVRLSTELATALELSAERVGLPIATQAMLLLRQALARTMESREYLERVTKAKVARTHDEYVHDMNVAAEGLKGEQRTWVDCKQPGVAEMEGGSGDEQEGWQRSVPEGTTAQADGSFPERGVGDRAGASGPPGMEEEA